MKKTLNQFPTISQMKEKIETYGKNIKNLEEQIELERNRKLTAINQLVSFCDDVLAGEYFKIGEKVIKIGQIENFFYKSGKFFVRVSLIDITVNSKVMKVFKNLELESVEVETLQVISEDEYKNEFFFYVNNHISKLVEENGRLFEN